MAMNEDFFESFHEKNLKSKQTECALCSGQSLRSQRGCAEEDSLSETPTLRKLVRVIAGEIFDVAVDLRRQSPTFGQWQGGLLSAENKRQFWVPPGFAHGFLTLSEFAEVLYKTTGYYAPDYERCIAWNDPQLAITWPTLPFPPILSSKDQPGSLFEKAKLF